MLSAVSFFFSPTGSTVFAEIQGVIDSCIKLSGMPDLSLSFMVNSVLHLAILIAWDIYFS